MDEDALITRPTPSTDLAYGNAPVLSLACERFTVDGYSRAGVQTYFRIPEWRLLLDHGNHPFEFTSSPFLALTHFHADHAAGLIPYLSSRNLLGQAPATVIYPARYEEALHDYLRAWSRLSGDVLHAHFVPARVGDEVPLGNKRFLRVIRTVHVVPSQGYVVFERRGKLRPELAGLPGTEIARRRRAGEAVEDSVEVPMLGFCGDTTVEALDLNPVLYDVRVLLFEATFVGDDPGPADARAWGHVHLDELAARAENFRNERLVLAHFSHRFRTADILPSCFQPPTAPPHHRPHFLIFSTRSR